MVQNDMQVARPVAPSTPLPPTDGMLNKVPEVTVFFWIIKVLCTTVGETASDFLNVNLGLGLQGTAIAAGIALLIAMVFQFRASRYVPALYWLTVVLISIFGTLVTDILTDSLGFPLEGSTLIFSVLLSLTFGVWYAKERTLSIHSVFTARREFFYWSAILFTFALGTASGDLMAEKLGLGYLLTGLIVLGVITAAGVAWRLGLDAVLGFWIAYILTRPLGASLGDYLSQSQENGGLGLGATGTSAIFLAAILAVVVFLAVTQRDAVLSAPAQTEQKKPGLAVVWQVVAVAALLIGASTLGYYGRSAQLRERAAASVTATAPLGDLSHFRALAGDMLRAERAGDATGAKARADDLESAWDNAQALLRPMNPAKWTLMDNAIDAVLKNVRSGSNGAVGTLEAFIHVMDTLADDKAAPRPEAEPSTQVSTSAQGGRPLGDLSSFRMIAERLQRAERASDHEQAKLHAKELETAWDQEQARIRPRSPEQWTVVDSAIDDVLQRVRSPQHDPAATNASLEALVRTLDRAD